MQLKGEVMGKRLEERFDVVTIDKYALHNACVMNSMTKKDLAHAMGKSHSYIDMVIRRGGMIRQDMYELMKGILRVTDDSLIKAIPVERGDEKTASLISPYMKVAEAPVTPVPNDCAAPALDDDNANFVAVISQIGKRTTNETINIIIRDYMLNSDLGCLYGQITSAVNRFDKT